MYVRTLTCKIYSNLALWQAHNGATTPCGTDVSEEPKEHKLVLIEDDFCGELDHGVWQAPFPNWEDSIVHFNSKRWAYLDDLLPERKEEAE